MLKTALSRKTLRLHDASKRTPAIQSLIEFHSYVHQPHASSSSNRADARPSECVACSSDRGVVRRANHKRLEGCRGAAARRRRAAARRRRAARRGSERRRGGRRAVLVELDDALSHDE